MVDLTLERHFAAAPQMVFDFVTREEHLRNWLGPVTMKCVEIDMNLTLGANWYAVIENAEGQTHKMSGKVTDTDAPNWVEFTWGWHGENDERGHESNVRFQVNTDGEDGSIFRIIHTNLPDQEAADNHNAGWTSTLTKLEAMLA
jgi:uncharacterized protein YndB with AHSA1/START domain